MLYSCIHMATVGVKGLTNATIVRGTYGLLYRGIYGLLFDLLRVERRRYCSVTCSRFSALRRQPSVLSLVHLSSSWSVASSSVSTPVRHSSLQP